MKRALLVEDNEQNLYYLKALLEGHGWTVACAANGALALAQAGEAPLDLIIADLLMPVMDGYTLLRRWKADVRLAQVPFVVYTATYTGSEDEGLAFALGADAFILKPAEPADFIAQIDAVRVDAKISGPKRPRADASADDPLLELYSETLVRKLERKTLQLEESNRALHEDQAELRMRDRAIQAVSQGIVITNPHAPDNPIVYASPSFAKLTGYDLEEVIGRNCRFLQGEETDPAATALLRAALAAGQAYTTELLNYRKDGSKFWNNLAISPVLGEDGELLQFVGVQTDVTERRELEAQLRQAQKLEAVGQLAAGIAHDFNNLLSVVLGYSICIAEQLPTNDPLREDIEEVRRAGDRATHLVRQLLAFSRGQLLEPQVLDLGELVLEMESLLQRLLGANVALSLFPVNGVGRVEADPTQLEQIVMNLAVNARDAMPDGGKLSIEVTDVELDAAYAALHAGVTPGPYVMLAITDSGTGMTRATRERIFEPFFTTKSVGKGTGLGLATVFGIVKQSRGHIGVSSELGSGSTFKVYLPRVDDATVPTRPSAPSPERLALRGNETILLVEDDEQLRVMACMILRRQGYKVLDAQNGGEAFLICEQHAATIDLLVSDLVMPRMNGRQLAERLATLRPKMKVLFMSGYAENAVVHQGVLDAGVAFLQKPITPSSLLKRVRQLLDSALLTPSSAEL
jgi:two-component system, cell cycle sensor histidine kinase and response regulator CckA